MASEELQYIRETGMEIAELNRVIQEKDNEIIRLNNEISRLEKCVNKHESTIENLSSLYNDVYYKQSDLIKSRNRYEKRFIAIAETLMCVLPELGTEVVKDLDGHEFFSKIIDTIEDKERRWW